MSYFVADNLHEVIKNCKVSSRSKNEIVVYQGEKGNRWVISQIFVSDFLFIMYKHSSRSMEG